MFFPSVKVTAGPRKRNPLIDGLGQANHISEGKTEQGKIKHTLTLLSLSKPEKYPSMYILCVTVTFLLTFTFSRDDFPLVVFQSSSFSPQILGLLVSASSTLDHLYCQHLFFGLSPSWLLSLRKRLVCAPRPSNSA